ncbi:hypothetical protein [Plantactinospora sp. B5E13]|uniref:hypothetical protein n=1 Tax=Plantactinospora sp. B5E13 TaxID=3153758 RepID=UPI00325F4CAD
MPASTPLRTAGAVLAGCLFATATPGAPALADTPPISVAMASSGTGAPRYEIRVTNETDGTVKTTVRQDLPPGTVPASVSEGGQAGPPGPGRTGTEVVWQVQLGARAVATLNTTLARPPGNTAVSAPACAFVANGNLPYDCATATWRPDGAAAGGSGGGGVAAESADSGPWWGGATVWGGGLGLLLLLSVAAAVFWARRLRRRRAAADVNRDVPDDTGSGRATTRDSRIIRRVGRPIARATARVRGDAKIPAPAEVLATTGHRSGPSPSSDAPSPGSDTTSPGSDTTDRDDVLRKDAAAPAERGSGAGQEGGLVGIAGGARYVGRAAIPPRTPVPGFDDEPATDEPDDTVATDQRPEEEPVEAPSRVTARAPRPRTSPPIKGVRRQRPPAWTAVGIAALAAVALATVTAWTGSSQVSAISGDRQPSSGAWVGRTVAGPLGTSLRESAFEFTVYRLGCPSGAQGCEAVVGVRNVTDRSQRWHAQLQRAYLPGGDWVGADVPATRIANAGRDPFAEPLPAGERLIVPVVFAPTGTTTPDRIELRSAVFSAGVSVNVPR